MADIERNEYSPLIRTRVALRGTLRSRTLLQNTIKTCLVLPRKLRWRWMSLFVNDIQQVSAAENEFLTSAFTEEEIRTAIFQMQHNKSPAEFYQFFGIC